MTHGICLMMANRGYLSPPNHYPDFTADSLGLLGFHIFLHLQGIIPKVHWENLKCPVQCYPVFNGTATAAMYSGR